MRMRKKKHTEERMEQCRAVWIKDAVYLAGTWCEIFSNNHPLHVEIGCGKGGFIVQMAKRNPDINFVAIECVPDCLVMAMEKAVSAGINNLRFLLGDAGEFLNYFAKEEINTIYLNFSDPWHKARHYKRRLTYRGYLDLYKTVLQPGGEIRQKTDNLPLFEFSITELETAGFMIKKIISDLHSSDIKDNIMTEYEKNFAAKGLPIYYLEAVTE